MDFLKEHLGDDLFKQVAEALKGKEEKVKLANLKDGQYIGLDKFKTAENVADDLRGEITTRDEQLAELKKSSGNAEELQTQIATLQKANEDAQADYSKKLASVAKKNAIGLAVSNARPVDKNAARSIELLIDPEIVKIDEDGKAIGLNDQLEAFRKESPYLFEENKPSKNSGSNPPLEDESGGEDDQLSDQEFFDKKMAERKP